MANDSLSNSPHKPSLSSDYHSKGKSKKLLHRVGKYITFILLFTSTLIIVILGVFQRSLFFRIVEIIKIVWPAILAALGLFGFVVNGVIKNPPKSFAKFLGNGFVQIAAWELFLFVFGLSAFAYWISRPGVINLQLTYAKPGQHITVLKTYIDSIIVLDTISAPGDFKDKPGKYTFKIIENGVYHDKKSGTLRPGDTLRVRLDDNRIMTRLIINSNPSGAAIWIDGSDITRTTPDTLNDLERKTFMLELKHPGFEDFRDWINLAHFEPNPERDLIKNLGLIRLKKFIQVTFDCAEGYSFDINGVRYQDIQNIDLPANSYNVTILRHGAIVEHRRITITGPERIIIP